ncbi:MAG TPA: class I SAM-dependent methyltransferase [Anaerolineales bacterium]
MDSTTADRLVELNRTFYEKFGESFSATRGRLQPGVLRLLSSLHGEESVLDLGCGNGELARELGRREHRGRYLGLDFSLSLLHEAQSRPPWRIQADFLRVDLTQLSSIGRLPVSGDWSFVACFAVLHHIPGESLRLDFLRTVRGWMEPGARLALSNWQFLNSSRLRARIQPWAKVGFTESQLDPGDALLDWKRDGAGLRYAHAFSGEELIALAAKTGFVVTDSFLSDGEGGNLGLYQTWQAR